MDFELSAEQELLRDNVARLMKDRYGFEARKGYQASPHGWSEALWRAYAEMGLTGAPFAEADGGFGGGAVETMIVMEEFGTALALEHYLQTVVLCGALIKHAASEKQRAELIGPQRSHGARLGSRRDPPLEVPSRNAARMGQRHLTRKRARDARVLAEWPRQFREPVRVSRHRILDDQHDQVAPARLHPGIAGRPVVEGGRAEGDQPRAAGGKQPIGAVGRTRVDRDDFVRTPGLRVDRVQQRRQRPRPVPRRDQHGDAQT